MVINHHDLCQVNGKNAWREKHEVDNQHPLNLMDDFYNSNIKYKISWLSHEPWGRQSHRSSWLLYRCRRNKRPADHRKYIANIKLGVSVGGHKELQRGVEYRGMAFLNHFLIHYECFFHRFLWVLYSDYRRSYWGSDCSKLC